MLALDKVALALFISTATADEVSTSIALHRNAGREGGMYKNPPVRLVVRSGSLLLYMKYQKKSKWLRYGVPAFHVLATANTIRLLRKER